MDGEIVLMVIVVILTVTERWYYSQISEIQALTSVDTLHICL